MVIVRQGRNNPMLSQDRDEARHAKRVAEQSGTRRVPVAPLAQRHAHCAPTRLWQTGDTVSDQGP